MCLKFPYSILAPVRPHSLYFSNHPAAHLHTFGCKHAHRSVEDVHPFTCVALIFIAPTPRVVQDDKKTALMIAMEKKNDAMVTALLDHNADPNIKDTVRQGPQ